MLEVGSWSNDVDKSEAVGDRAAFADQEAVEAMEVASSPLPSPQKQQQQQPLSEVKEILKTGIKLQKSSLKAVRILKTVKYKKDTAWAKFEPSDYPRMSFSIEFSEEVIGAQSKTLDMSNGSFVRELCDSRTFCRHSEVEAMRSKGLALGGSYDNAVVVDGKDVLSPGGLRHSDEPVRHKMLDALGDIALAGYPILGHYIGHRAGHGITHGLLKSLFSDSKNFEIISCDQDIVDTLPGSGVQLSEVCKVA